MLLLLPRIHFIIFKYRSKQNKKTARQNPTVCLNIYILRYVNLNYL